MSLKSKTKQNQKILFYFESDLQGTRGIMQIQCKHQLEMDGSQVRTAAL